MEGPARDWYKCLCLSCWNIFRFHPEAGRLCIMMLDRCSLSSRCTIHHIGYFWPTFARNFLCQFPFLFCGATPSPPLPHSPALKVAFSLSDKQWTCEVLSGLRQAGHWGRRLPGGGRGERSVFRLTVQQLTCMNSKFLILPCFRLLEYHFSSLFSLSLARARLYWSWSVPGWTCVGDFHNVAGPIELIPWRGRNSPVANRDLGSVCAKCRVHEVLLKQASKLTDLTYGDRPCSDEFWFWVCVYIYIYAGELVLVPRFGLSRVGFGTTSRVRNSTTSRGAHFRTIKIGFFRICVTNFGAN